MSHRPARADSDGRFVPALHKQREAVPTHCRRICTGVTALAPDTWFGRTVCPCYGRKHLLHTWKQVIAYTKIKPMQSGFLALKRLLSLCVPALDSKCSSTYALTSVPNASAVHSFIISGITRNPWIHWLFLLLCSNNFRDQLPDVLSPSNQKGNPWQDVSWENMLGSHHAGQQLPSSKLCLCSTNQLFHYSMTVLHTIIHSNV